LNLLCALCGSQERINHRATENTEGIQCMN